jgi:hypothetical protein
LSVLVPVAPLVAALLLASCDGPDASGARETGDIANEAGESGEYVIDRETGEARMTIETEEGPATLRSGRDVPVELPEGFSLHPGSRVTSNSVIRQGERSGAVILFETEATPEEVIAHYRREAEAAGFALETDTVMGDSLMLGGESAGVAFQATATAIGAGGARGQVFVSRAPE